MRLFTRKTVGFTNSEKEVYAIDAKPVYLCSLLWDKKN